MKIHKRMTAGERLKMALGGFAAIFVAAAIGGNAASDDAGMFAAIIGLLGIGAIIGSLIGIQEY